MRLKTDLTMYGDGELTQEVYNDVYFKRLRHLSCIVELLDDHYVYTDDQLSDLIDTLDNEGL